MKSPNEVNHWYLAGPMSRIPQFNVPAFLDGAVDLRGRGLTIQLPADLDDPKVVEQLLASPDGVTLPPGGPTWGQCLAEDVILIADIVGGIIVLPGWEKSRGARLETFTSYALCDKPVVYYPTLEPVPARILAEAWTAPVLAAA